MTGPYEQNQVPSPPGYPPPVAYPHPPRPASDGTPSTTWPAPPVPAPVSGPVVGPPVTVPRRRRSVAGIFALVLVILLGGVAGYEWYLVRELGQDLRDAERRAAAEQTDDDGRLDRLEGRASELEKQVGGAFNPAAVAQATLPSVFRVKAGQFSGTAFAVGRQPAAGGTYLLTNFHVVEASWTKGIRTVDIQREEDKLFKATITKVDEAEDVALLESKETFPRLTTATAKIKPGEPVAVVGAPLGLTGSVTTGVVSTYRTVPEVRSEVVQFDAAINPGNSGGPVINSQKQVVGIATLKAREAEGIGLAVQIETACKSMAIC